VTGQSRTSPDHGPGRWPAAGPEQGDALRAVGWVTWAGPAVSPFPPDPTYHQHEYGKDRAQIAHRHVNGADAHDHDPGAGDLEKLL
jgi:hypothetical protein